MPFEWTAFNFWTLVVALMTLGMIRLRFSAPVDTPWAMIYYVILVLYVRGNEGEYENYAIFAGVVSAMFIRFEFMAGFTLKLFKFIEYMVHCYILTNAFIILMVRPH